MLPLVLWKSCFLFILPQETSDPYQQILSVGGLCFPILPQIVFFVSKTTMDESKWLQVKLQQRMVPPLNTLQ